VGEEFVIATTPQSKYLNTSR